MIDLADLIGWVAAVFYFLGIRNLGKKKVSGFYYMIICHLVFLAQSIVLRLTSLFVIDIMSIILTSLAIREWRRDGDKNEKKRSKVK